MTFVSKFVLGDLVSRLRLTQFKNNVCLHFIHRHLITRAVMVAMHLCVMPFTNAYNVA